MDDITVNVNNHDIVTTNTVNNIKISVRNITLFKNVSLIVRLYTGTVLVDNRFLILSGDDYNNWMNDDNYIITYVLQAFGLTKVTVST
jgi:hypothetical protein